MPSSACFSSIISWVFYSWYVSFVWPFLSWTCIFETDTAISLINFYAAGSAVSTPWWSYWWWWWWSFSIKSIFDSLWLMLGYFLISPPSWWSWWDSSSLWSCSKSACESNITLSMIKMKEYPAKTKTKGSGKGAAPSPWERRGWLMKGSDSESYMTPFSSRWKWPAC